MSTVRIALANTRVPATPDDAVCIATSAIADASHRGALVICFPECFVPGYRRPGTTAPPPDPVFLERAWVGDRAAGWHTAVLSAVRTGRPARGGPRHRNRTAGRAVPDVADVIRLD